MATVTNEQPSGFKGIFRALRHRNYRLYYMGQGISLIGTWMQQMAMQWLIYRLTNSPFLLGMIGFLSNIPSLALAPVAGVLADRWNRQRMLIIVQTAAMLQAAVLAILVMTNTATVLWLLLLAACLGIVNAFDMPIRQAFVLDMLEDPHDLGNAIALNSSMVNGARLIGPSVGGILIAAVGEGLCFLVNALSYIAVIIALFAMRIRPLVMVRQSGSLVKHLKEGAEYVWNFTPIRAIVLLLALINLVAMPYAVLMPIFARKILGGGPQTLGFLMGAVGTGALIGAIFLAARTTVRGLLRIIPLASALFGGALIAFSFSRTLPLSLALMLFSGFGMMVNMASSNTVLQTIADEDKRGRVMSFYTVAFRGVFPLGALMAGSLAAHFGAQATLALGGGIGILAAIFFFSRLPNLRAKIRPIYIQKGIITPAVPPVQDLPR